MIHSPESETVRVSLPPRRVFEFAPPILLYLPTHRSAVTSKHYSQLGKFREYQYAIGLNEMFVRKYPGKYLNPISFPPFFENVHGHHGINLSHKSMRQSGSPATRLSNVGRLTHVVTLGCLLFKISLFGSLWYSAYFYKFCRMKDIYKNERISKLMWFVCLQRSFSFKWIRRLAAALQEVAEDEIWPWKATFGV